MNLRVHENLIKSVGSKQSCLSGNNKKNDNNEKLFETPLFK